MRIARQRTRHVPILMYHSIADEASRHFAPFSVSPRRFAHQMAYLAEAGYTPLTVTQLVDAWAGRQLPARPIVLTFDDGFADFRTHALPVLQHHGFTATLFVTTGFVGETSRWLAREGEGDRPLLSWPDLTAVSAAGIECGGHSHTHPELDSLSPDRARAEIVECRDRLEQALDRPVATFAYPFGYHNAAVQAIVRESGYRAACAVKYSISRPSDDRYALGRLIVTGTMSHTAFVRLVSTGGATADQWLRRVRSAGWKSVRHTRHAFIGMPRAREALQ